MIGLVQASAASIKVLERLRSAIPRDGKAFRSFLALIVSKPLHHARKAMDVCIYEPVSCAGLLVLLSVSIISVTGFPYSEGITIYKGVRENRSAIREGLPATLASGSFEDVFALKPLGDSARSGAVSPGLNYPYGVIGRITWDLDEANRFGHLHPPINDLVAPSATFIVPPLETVADQSRRGSFEVPVGLSQGSTFSSGETTLAAETSRTTASPTLSGTPNSINAIRGVTDKEIRFGIVAPFSGSAKELGRQMKIGIETAFNLANDAGGINGRQIRLFSKDDGYEPSRTADAMRQLLDRDQVLGTIGNVGTPTAAVALPLALEHKLLFFGAFTGANLLRSVPPDHYVFNYRPSYAEETEGVVRYLMKVRGLQPREIAVFAQQDSYGDAGFEGVTRALRRAGYSAPVLRLNYTRNTVDVVSAVEQLGLQKGRTKAVVMVATYRAAAKFIEQTRDRYPKMIYTNVSFVGSTALADELILQGPRFVDGVIVTQVVPAVNGYSRAVLDYKTALAKYFPGEAADYVSFEGYIDAKILIEGLRRAGLQLSTESLIDALESIHDLDMGLGTILNYGPSEHQASHHIWGTQLDKNGRFNTLDLE